MITRIQVRMARAALGWGVRDLGKRAGISANTVSRYENGFEAMSDTLQLIQDALEAGGVMFIPADATAGPGVRLKQKKERRLRK